MSIYLLLMTRSRLLQQVCQKELPHPSVPCTIKRTTSKKMRLFVNSTNVATPQPAITTMPISTAATSSALLLWEYGTNGTVQMPAASKMAKSRMVKPAVDEILNAVSVESQAAILFAVTDQPSLTTARILAGIDMSKAIVAMKFLCEQSSRMMSRNRTMQNMCGNTTNEKRDAAKVMLTFSAPLPNSKSNAVPSICA
jgi:hypothetical protein